MDGLTKQCLFRRPWPGAQPRKGDTLGFSPPPKSSRRLPRSVRGAESAFPALYALSTVS